MSVGPEHERWLQQAVDGDEEALQRLIEAHHPVLERVLRGEIPRKWQAVLTVSDVLQETYIDAFLDIRDFQPREANSFEGWLLTIARNNLRSAVRGLEAARRGGGRKPVQPDEDAYTEVLEAIVGSSTPSRKAARQEAKAALERGIRQLPEEYGRVIRMLDLEHQPVEVVSQELQRSTAAVYMLRYRAHRALRKLLIHFLQDYSEYS